MFTAGAYSADSTAISAAIRPPAIYQGQVVVIKASPPPGMTSLQYNAGGRSVSFWKDDSGGVYAALLGIDLEEKPGPHSLTIHAAGPDGKKRTQTLAYTVLEKTFPAQYLTVPESKVSLSRKNRARYEREKKILDAMFAGSSQKKIWHSPFQKPLPAEVDTPFGVRRFFNNKPKNPHSGVDFKAARGAPVAASGDGIVALTGDFFFPGKSVFIDHGTGVITMYFHLDSIAVTKGDTVSAGETIGLVGSTGRATGPHLHWGARVNNQRVDPLSLLSLFSDTKTLNLKP